MGLAMPEVRVGNPCANADAIIELADEADEEGCDVLLSPELGLTGYTCADLFQQRPLLEASLESLTRIARRFRDLPRLLGAIGLPLVVDGKLYNTVALIQHGAILGIVPKTYIPNYGEYYERRWFHPADGSEPAEVRIGEANVPFGNDLLFEAESDPEVRIGVEICEDLWVPIPPSSRLSLAGAVLLLNASASCENTGKAEYRRDLVVGQSARCVAAYAYASAGVSESTTDLVFGGHGFVSENGHLLTERERFSRKSELKCADIDVERLVSDRMRMTTFTDRTLAKICRTVRFHLEPSRPAGALRRFVPAHPFVPNAPETRSRRCREIFATQTSGLAKRWEIARPNQLHVGISGGLDSTLALLVAVRTADLIGRDRKEIVATTMPGFGTSQRTRRNAERLMELLGVTSQLVDIRELCLQQFRMLEHRPFGIDTSSMSVEEFQKALAGLEADNRSDLIFENVQARTRTLLLMDQGFVLGTGDLSELALGWCTYNGDHMSMYNPNASIPKTLVRLLVTWVAENEFEGETREVLQSVAETEISPELLPIGENDAIQSTESTIGPYELHDFFLYNVLRFGFRPAKILFLAQEATFSREYPQEELRRWLSVFYRRFFQSQFKRSCLPDGPKVGSISLSPRGDWRMPSDAEAAAWLAELSEESPT
ncbi:Glutamine-dependent NAD(+) synthetase [Planctomycetes bacterium Pan216]|uniref:Glutamine-dependent NAD(+) synthetase n=1 Tax=Kolteria novifilia TaxID=2527975 RepID=A0A518B157_9BACT|nr:Glutamine-dependent NAD(+) synthetase [Planctomycetes bacterium Pan216]